MAEAVDKRINQAKFNFLLAAVFAAAIFIFLPYNVFSQSASFYLSPAQGTYEVGEKFFVYLLVNADGIAINASQAKVHYPTDKLEVISFSKTGSIFALWVEEPAFSNNSGMISFAGGLPNPGFIGKAGKILTIIFRAKEIGEAEVSLTDEKILANDAHGTDVFASSRGGKYTIKKAEAAPSPLPLEPGKTPAPIIDTQPPYPFEIMVDNEGDATNPSPLLYFEAKDDLSGISHYEIKIGENLFKAKPGETMPWRIPFLLPGSYHLSVKAFDKAGNSTESTAEVKVEPLPTPKITLCPKVFSSGEEVLYVMGTSQAKNEITVFFEKDGELIKKWETLSNESGEWSFASEGLFRPGVYKIYVRAKDKRGAISSFSEPCSTRVILNAFMIGSWIISYKLLAIILLILFGLLLLILFWLFGRIIRNRRTLERETEDLENKFYKEYYELREDIRKQLEMFKKAHGRRPLTEKEKAMGESLLKNLADVEQVLKREIKDIENIK